MRRASRSRSALELEWVYAREYDAAIGGDPDLGDRGRFDIGALVARRQQVNALIRRAAQSGGKPLAGDVAAVNEDIEAIVDGRAVGQGADLVERAARERE